jgi:hypothetical protein
MCIISTAQQANPNVIGLVIHEVKVRYQGDRLKGDAVIPERSLQKKERYILGKPWNLVYSVIGGNTNLYGPICNLVQGRKNVFWKECRY